ncbi:uncharacterized protein LOC132944756 [Metopolophium dirhodum]|uniref:uncharacterized protein LOC132944756 n=1 Tax=Metopolophium dirhodum TaxID=44670 RepID=UPI00298FD298|nr:uncharacterized protein LOC132944756 [Metopolophium dirhodum]
MKLSIFFLFSVFVVNLSFCESKPNKKPTSTTTKPATSTYSPPVSGCVYMVNRESAGDTTMNFDDVGLLDTTTIDFKETGLNQTTDFARHHVIPWHRISSFFNLVLLGNKKTQYGLCTIMYNLMNKLMNRSSNQKRFDVIALPISRKNIIFKLLESTKSERIDLMVGHSVYFDLEEIVKDIHRFFTWFPGNIFIGPEPTLKRGDDPKENFEESAIYIIGQTHHKILKDMDTQMKKFINEYTNLSVNMRHTIINDVAKSLNDLLPYSATPFNPKNWYSKNNKWYIKHEYLKSYPIYTGIIPVPDPLPTSTFELRKTQLQLYKTGCRYDNMYTYDDMYNSIISEIRKNCISSDSSCGCQKRKKVKL